MGVSNYTSLSINNPKFIWTASRYLGKTKQLYKNLKPNDSHLRVNKETKDLRRDTTEIVRKFDG